MKKQLVLVMLLWHGIAKADPTQGEVFYLKGAAYLAGISKPYNPLYAKQFFWQAAALSNTQAMLGLGHIYAKGKGNKASIDSAEYWLVRSVKLGETKAFWQLGSLYQHSTLHDFITAESYYKKGVVYGDVKCKNALAYLYYKGLGSKQDYQEAFKLYNESAEAGNTNSKYFLGLCYRNGYGINPDSVKAQYWLAVAASEANDNALRELSEEKTPENLSVITPVLQDRLSSLNKYVEKFKADDNNNYEGSYNGYAVYYDWSGKYVSEILPLEIRLQKTSTGYVGNWKEGESESYPVSLSVSNNVFRFDSDNKYIRVNHYSGRKPEVWNFNNAALKLGFVSDSIQLSGTVKFFSNKRNEPGKPFQIFVQKKIEQTVSFVKQLDVSIYPNPANDFATVKFVLESTAKVGIVVYSQNGSAVFSQDAKLLQRGSYSYPIDLTKYSSGAYSVRIMINSQIVAARTIIKQ